MFHTSSRKRQLGQGMSEYIIITALIAVAGIGVFAAFGDTISSQAAAMAQEMAGQSSAQEMQAAAADAGQAATRSGQDDDLQNYNSQN